MIARLTFVLLLCAQALAAQTLSFPSNATLLRDVSRPADSVAMPTGVWQEGVLPTVMAEGLVTQQAWRINAAALTTLQLIRPLREQLRNARFRILFECEAADCGGFDFRFAVETLPPPEMQINIADYRFLAAERAGDDGTTRISLFVSRTAGAGYVQVTRVGPPSQQADPVVTQTGIAMTDPETLSVAGLDAQFAQTGRVILPGLVFQSASAQLDAAEVPALAVLADYLRAYPQRRVALVGHTDATGSLDANIALSKRRAASVLERLVADFDIPRAQLAAEGMGYLSPLATNLTAEGRAQNRRVEVIVLPDR